MTMIKVVFRKEIKRQSKKDYQVRCIVLNLLFSISNEQCYFKMLIRGNKNFKNILQSTQFVTQVLIVCTLKEFVNSWKLMQQRSFESRSRSKPKWLQRWVRNFLNIATHLVKNSIKNWWWDLPCQNVFLNFFGHTNQNRVNLTCYTVFSIKITLKVC